MNWKPHSQHQLRIRFHDKADPNVSNVLQKQRLKCKPNPLPYSPKIWSISCTEAPSSSQGYLQSPSRLFSPREKERVERLSIVSGFNAETTEQSNCLIKISLQRLRQRIRRGFNWFRIQFAYRWINVFNDSSQGRPLSSEQLRKRERHSPISLDRTECSSRKRRAPSPSGILISPDGSRTTSELPLIFYVTDGHFHSSSPIKTRPTMAERPINLQLHCFDRPVGRASFLPCYGPVLSQLLNSRAASNTVATLIRAEIDHLRNKKGNRGWNTGLSCLHWFLARWIRSVQLTQLVTQY